MEKDLIAELDKIRNHDIIYHVKAKIERLLAPQRQKNMKFLNLPSSVATVIVDTTDTTYGSGDEQVTSSRVKKRNIKKAQDIKVWCFPTEGKEILEQITGDRGVIRTGFYRTVQAMNKAKFWAPPIDLIRVLPDDKEFMSLGKAPPERNVEHPIFVLEPRRNKTSAELVGYEAVYNRTIEFDVRVNTACPLDENEILTLLHGLEDVPLGAAKRGHLKILELTKITPD